MFNIFKIKDPCKKCIVRACCTLICMDKVDHQDTMEIISFKIDQIKDVPSNLKSWFKNHWPEMIGITIIGIEVVVIILLGIYLPMKG